MDDEWGSIENVAYHENKKVSTNKRGLTSIFLSVLEDILHVTTSTPVSDGLDANMAVLNSNKDKQIISFNMFDERKGNTTKTVSSRFFSSVVL